jgi:hypothetical protein
MEPDAVDTSLHYSRLVDGRWSESRTVVSGAPIFVNWADLPSVVPMRDEHLVAHWLEQSPDDIYSYDVRVAQSVDGGTSWLAAITPHSDNTLTEHGFVSIFEHGDRAGLMWLDGRKMINEVTDDPIESGMTLRGAFIDAASVLDGEQRVDELVCDCCQTDIAVTASGPIAIYRDRSVDEIRDISVTRFMDGSWQPGQNIAADNWEIAGCPVNGPSITAQDDSIAVAWFTAADSIPSVRFATSVNGGVSFSAAVEVIAEDTLGRVGVAILNDDAAAVSWLQNNADGNANVMVRKIDSNGQPGTAVVISKTATQFAVPQMERVGDYLIFAWTETHDYVDRIASARILINALEN